MPDQPPIPTAAQDFADALKEAWLEELPREMAGRLNSRQRKLIAAVAADAAALHAEMSVAAAANRVTPRLVEAHKHVAAQMAQLNIALRADARASFGAAWLKTLERAKTFGGRVFDALLTGKSIR